MKGKQQTDHDVKACKATKFTTLESLKLRILDQLKLTRTIFKLYSIFAFSITFGFYLQEELRFKGSPLRKFAIKNLMNVQPSNLFEYLGNNEFEGKQMYDVPEFIEEIDYRELSVHDFVVNYLQKSKPAIFRGYAKIQPAYEKWQNSTYLIDQVNDEIIFTERAPLGSNQFVYFKKDFKKEYMTYREFIGKMNEPNRMYNYYFAQENVPSSIYGDIILPHFLEEHSIANDIAFWQGIGTVTMPHHDTSENMMCVFKGHKNFTIVSPYQTKYVYPGYSDTAELAPINYSPINFEKPDYEKFPLFKEAKAYHIHLTPGDCLFLPGHWWHQVTSSHTECIAVSFWYQPNNLMTEIFYIADENID